MTQSFDATLQETLEYVERALTRIKQGEGPETEAHNIRATLELTDRDPGIEAAADDLYATATAFVAGRREPEDGAERRDERLPARRS